MFDAHEAIASIVWTTCSADNVQFQNYSLLKWLFIIMIKFGANRQHWHGKSVEIVDINQFQ